MNRFAAIIFFLCLGSCEEPTSKIETDPWQGFSKHEKIFDCMYSGDVDQLPESLHPEEDYTLMITGHWKRAEDIPEIAAIIASKADKTIKTAVGLTAIEELFSTLEPHSTIRRYYKCTVPLTYEVPRDQIEQAEKLIPEGLIWNDPESGDNVICTCPKDR